MAVMTDIGCTLPRPDIAQLAEDVRTELSKRLLGGAPVLPMSSEDVLSYVMAGTVNLMHGFVTQALKENDPATMCCDNLIKYGARHGIDLAASTRAKGYVALSGDPGALIPSTMRLVGASSLEYKLDPAVVTNPTALDGTGHAAVRVTAVTGGVIFDAPAGTILTVSSTTTGIDGEATVVGNGITGGADDETCDEFRRRVIAIEQAGVIVPNLKWFIEQTLRYPGVTRACADDCDQCCDLTFLPIYPFMEGVYGDVNTAPYGVPPAEVLNEMSQWMWGDQPGRGQGLAPFGVRGLYATALPTVVNVTAYCFKGCNAVADQIKTALQTYIRAFTCVGSAVCKDQLRGMVYRTIGADMCLSSITLDFDDSLAFEDSANAYLACGHFLVVGDINLVLCSP